MIITLRTGALDVAEYLGFISVLVCHPIEKKKSPLIAGKFIDAGCHGAIRNLWFRIGPILGIRIVSGECSAHCPQDVLVQ